MPYSYARRTRRLDSVDPYGYDVGFFLVGERHFWLRTLDGQIVAARDDEEPFSDDENLWQAAPELRGWYAPPLIPLPPPSLDPAILTRGGKQ